MSRGKAAEFLRKETLRYTALPSGSRCELLIVKTIGYFRVIRERPDRKIIQDEWIKQVMENPIAEAVQQDGRIRRWGIIQEMENRVLRVVLLADGKTLRNAFFDRSFRKVDQ